MNSMSKRRCVILLLMGLTACGGKEQVSSEDQQDAAFADLRVAVDDTVTDEASKSEVMQLVDELESDVDKLREILVMRRAEIRRLNADYDVTREDFLNFANETEVRIQENRRNVLAARARLVNATTQEEWNVLTKVETKAMKTIIQSHQGL